MFKTIAKNEQAEIVEKKSKFIANIFYVENLEEAENIIKEIKKKYFDARHNCFAFRISDNEGTKERFSDDGEPSGTAGGPMLNILASQNISNVLVIVTRYFGGILLGTGGLIRAYSQAVQEVLNKVELVEKDIGIEAELKTSYSEIEKLKYYCKIHEIEITELEYLENVKVRLEMTKEKYFRMEKEKKELNFEIKEIKILKEKYITL